MSDLADFLLARIAEDEEDAPRHLFDRARGGLIGMRERVLAECEAKRRVVEQRDAYRKHYHETWDVRSEACWLALEDTMKILALTYSGHPDYRQAFAI